MQAMYVHTTKSRLYYLDFLRAIGCLAVVLLHVSSKFTLDTLGSTNYWLGIIFDTLSQFAVPVFVMISGVLFLDENYTFSVAKLATHIKRLIIFFAGWSLIFFLVFTIVKNYLLGIPVSFVDSLSSLVRGPYHLWFIPMIIGLYLIVPLLRLWVKKENKTAVEYFLLLGVLFNIVFPKIRTIFLYICPQCDSIFSSTDRLYFHYSLGYVLYFVLGWYINTFEIEAKYAHKLYIIGLFCVLVAILGTYYFTIWKNDTSFFMENFSICIFSIL